MTSDETEYRSRGFDRESHERVVRNLLERLADAEAKTDPSRGPESAMGKGHEAFRALLAAGELVEVVAGWAIDHVCGLSLSGKKVMPNQPFKTRAHPEYFQNRDFADRHEHERAGGEISSDGTSLTAVGKQTLLRNLLFGGSMGGPHWLRDEAFRAFDALAFGETLPLLAASETNVNAKVRYEELHAQLRLVAIVHFRAMAYGGVARAQEFVAKRAGIGFETLRTWKRRLYEELGRLEVDRTLEFAANSAGYVKYAADRRKDGLTLTKEDFSLCEGHERQYGVGALDMAIAEYRNVKRPE